MGGSHPFRISFVVFLSFLLSACTSNKFDSSLHPIPPEILYKPFAPAYLPDGEPNTQYSPSSEMSVVSSLLKKMVDAASTASINSSKQDWWSGDVTTGGAIMAAAGALADQTGLLNSGIGLGVLGGTARGRYQFDIQGVHYLKASRSLSCVLNQVNFFTDDLRAVAVSYANAAAQEVDKAKKPIPNNGDSIKQAALEAPNVAIEAVNAIQYQLLADLRGIAAKPATKDEISALIVSAQTANETPPKLSDSGKNIVKKEAANSLSNFAKSLGASTTPDTGWIQDLAAKRALAFEVNVKACAVR